MDVRIISAVFICLLSRASAQSHPGSTVTPPSQQNQSEPSVSGPTGTKAPPPPPALGLLTVSWTDQSCEGEVLLLLPGHAPSRCLQQQGAWLLGTFGRGLSGVCRGGRSCGGSPRWHQGQNITCPTLRVTCTVSPVPPEGACRAELRSYKVAAGVLCVLLLLGLLVLLGKIFPSSLRAMHNRISERRRSRWIGPTQSQSVSYHRGKSAVENNTEKRFSFAALERLTVSDSREPSSNRNSGFTF